MRDQQIDRSPGSPKSNQPAEELAAALRELQTTQSHLAQSEKMASIGQLAAGVAHEINNPIGFISSNLNSLRQYVKDLQRMFAAYHELVGAHGPGGSKLDARLDEIQRVREEIDLDFILADVTDLISESIEGANRVREIVADLRDFAHVDSPDVAEEDVNDLLDKTINVAWNELKYKADIVREFGDVPGLPCYGGKLGQVFLNLLVNAAQAIADHGTITIRTGHDGDIVWIEVADTGCGMPAEILSRVFEPFFTTKEMGRGTGLGLHLAYKIVEAHGGRIDVRSTAGAGTMFRIELPVTGPPEAKESHGELAA